MLTSFCSFGCIERLSTKDNPVKMLRNIEHLLHFYGRKVKTLNIAMQALFNYFAISGLQKRKTLNYSQINYNTRLLKDNNDLKRPICKLLDRYMFPKDSS